MKSTFETEHAGKRKDKVTFGINKSEAHNSSVNNRNGCAVRQQKALKIWDAKDINAFSELNSKDEEFQTLKMIV